MKTILFQRIALVSIFIIYSAFAPLQAAVVRGRIVDAEQQPVVGATVKIGSLATAADVEGRFSLSLDAGTYTLSVEALGYEKFVQRVVLPTAQAQQDIRVHLHLSEQQLAEVQVVGGGVGRVKRSAYNVLAVDARSLHNTTKSLADALNNLPGMRLRESGGVGSDTQLMMDGFGGRHVRIFIDGVPQEGVGRAFSLSNIPINFAERIEVYKGVVPVGLGSDALGGVVNIVTKRGGRPWWVDASYSFGSYRTHRSYVNFGQTFRSGWTYEVNLFQNYSANNYKITTPVEIFNEDGSSYKDLNTLYSVHRFHDTYHNEAAVARVGVINRGWADRLMFGFTYARQYKDIQTGVTQDVVYGGKFRRGYSLMPSLEWRKRNLFAPGLDVLVTANYNRNITQNVDTAAQRWNWLGQSKYAKTPGEQAYQDNRLTNNNWNATTTVSYHPTDQHLFTFNHVVNSFRRTIATAAGVSDGMAAKNAIARQTTKNISGLSYRYMPSVRWNATAFVKFYQQWNAGPVLPTGGADNAYIRFTNSVRSLGYGAAATWMPLTDLQLKLSYEKAFRLPTNDELFGDEDLELGTVGLRPEQSHNFNFNVAYTLRWNKHRVYLEGEWINRRTRDFIQRSITGSYSGGKRYASYYNHGRVRTSGWSASLRYSYEPLLSIGASISDISTRDNVRTVAPGSSQKSVTYGVRMPNIPYFFYNCDAQLRFNNFGAKGNRLTLTYDNLYVRHYSLYPENLGDAASRIMIPTQFSHNFTATYSVKRGQWAFSLECRNFTNARLYDNFSLQKPGRAFYGKVRVALGPKH